MTGREPVVPGAEYYLNHTGGRRACPHPAHRFAQVPDSPARVILPECAGREHWLKARERGIGGSEVAALVGASEYDTAFSVWQKKITGDTKDIGDLPAVEWGHRLEDVVGQKTADVVGLTPRFAGGLWADREKPHLRVTPDRFATRARSWRAVGLIECKTAGNDEHWANGTISPGGQGDGAAPLNYQAQIQWQMGIIGLDVGWLGCFHLGSERNFFTVEVKRDRKWFAEMVKEADRFWQENVLGREMPMHDLKHPVTESLLKTLHPKVTTPSVDLPEGAEEWLREYREAKEELERAEGRMSKASNYFRMMTGSAGAGYIPWNNKEGRRKVVSYPEVTGSRVDVEKLRDNFPEVARAVTVTSSYRRMTVTVPKSLD